MAQTGDRILHSLFQNPFLNLHRGFPVYRVIIQGSHCTVKIWKMAKKTNIPVRENTGNLEVLPKHREFSCSSCRFSDSKETGYCDICYEIFEVPF